MTDPADAVRVYGGPSLTKVDAKDVRVAAAVAGEAADQLRDAAFRVVRAAEGLDGMSWSVGRGALAWPRDDGAASGDDGLAGCGVDAGRLYRGVADDAGAVARRLRGRADECALLAERLLRAAGLYEEGESAVERLVGAGIEAGLSVATRVLVTTPFLWPGIIGSGLGAYATGWLANRATGGWAGRWFAATAADAGRLAVRGIAPWSDEVVAGVGHGVASGLPLLSQGDSSVAGAARVLASLVQLLMPEARVRVRRSGVAASWGSTPSGTVDTVLARVDALYPSEPGEPGVSGEPGGGAEPATIAVERVEHADGTVSWTVLIPGTQGFLGAENPFDAQSDVELLAQHTADVTVGVEAALTAAGAAPDEDVVLAGHSLGGMAAMALAESASFRSRHKVGGVITAGSPTVTYTVPRGIPVLHVENEQELVSNLDGKAAAENPRTEDRVTVGIDLTRSSDSRDQQAAGSIGAAHGVPTHRRTLAAGLASGNAALTAVAGRLDALVSGTTSSTSLYTIERVPLPPLTPAPQPGPAPTAPVAAGLPIPPPATVPGIGGPFRLGTVAPLSGGGPSAVPGG